MHRQQNIKSVEFYSKNKLEKLAHLVSFIIRIYHDARSRERQKRRNLFFEYLDEQTEHVLKKLKANSSHFEDFH